MFREPPVEHEWFYAENDASVGPLSFDALVGALRRMAEPEKTLVWHAGLEAWQQASDIAELASHVGKPIAEVAVKPDPRLDRWTASGPAAEVWDDGDAPAVSKRRWSYVAAITLAIAIIGGAIYAPRVLEPIGASEVRIALPGAPAQPKPQPQPAKPNPAVLLAQLHETASQAAAATDAVALKLWDAIEPPTMRSPPDFTTASRDPFEAYLRDLKTAEANAAAARQKFAALLEAERGLIEETARSSGLDEASWSDLRAAVGDRHGASLELAGRMLQARGELYRALQAMQSIVLEQFGKYKVGADGQIRFATKAVTDRAVAATERINAANQLLERIEMQMLNARQAPQQATQPAWKEMTIKQQAGTP